MATRKLTDPTETCESDNHSSDDSRHGAISVRLLSGSIGSILTSLVVTPLEVVKVRLQASAAETARTRNVARCPQGCGTFVFTNFAGQTQMLPRNRVSFFDSRTGTLTEAARQTCSGSDGIWRTLKRIHRVEGLSGVYAGLRPTLVMAVPNTVIYFSAYEELAYRLHGAMSSEPNQTHHYGSSWLVPIISGSSARFLASSVTAPFEFMRTRQALMEGTNQPHSSLWNDMKSVVREEGATALYKGFRPTLWRDVPFSAIYWMCLENMREAWKLAGYERTTLLEQAAQAFVNGLFSGSVAAACTTPFDVVKTRQQQQVAKLAEEQVAAESGALLCKHDGAIAVDAYRRSNGTGTLSQLRHIAEAEGVAGLWRGNWTRMLKVAPSCAIMISTYELGKRLLE